MGALLLAVGVALASAGCTAPVGSPGTMLNPWRLVPAGLGKFSAKAERETLRKKVEADSFPTASQAGL